MQKTQPQKQHPTDWTSKLACEARGLIKNLDEHPMAQRLFKGIIDSNSYARWLVQTYHAVRWTSPLLKKAGRRLKRLGRHPQLAELLLQKTNEERGHERWLLADLRNQGWTLEQVERSKPSPAVVAYVAWNRFTSEVGSPTAFLGTGYMLESLSVHRAGVTVEKLLERGAIPNIRKSVTFLRGHAGADGGHVAELTAVLRTLTDPAEQADILLSARTTGVLYSGFFPEVS